MVNLLSDRPEPFSHYNWKLELKEISSKTPDDKSSKEGKPECSKAAQ